MTRRISALLAALAIAVTATFVAPAPSHAATRHWTTIKQTPRHLKGQVCTGPKWSVDGVRPFYYTLFARGSARSASIGGWSQVQYRDSYDHSNTKTSGWQWVSAGHASKDRMFIATSMRNNGVAVQVRMRIRTRFGTSHWGVWREWNTLSRC